MGATGLVGKENLSTGTVISLKGEGRKGGIWAETGRYHYFSSRRLDTLSSVDLGRQCMERFGALMKNECYCRLARTMGSEYTSKAAVVAPGRFPTSTFIVFDR